VIRLRWEDDETGSSAYLGEVWAGRVSRPSETAWSYRIELRFVASRRLFHNGLVRNRASAVRQVEKVFADWVAAVGLADFVKRPPLNVASLVEAAVGELDRQAQEDREGAPYVDGDNGPADFLIDGRIDLEALALAIAAALLEPEAKP